MKSLSYLRFLVASPGLSCLGADTQTPRDAVPTLEIKKHQVMGTTLLSQEQLDAILNPYCGREATFKTIRRGLGELQLAYRSRGYVTVSVALPQ